MKIKNFTLIASNHNLEIELKNLTKMKIKRSIKLLMKTM